MSEPHPTVPARRGQPSRTRRLLRLLMVLMISIGVSFVAVPATAATTSFAKLDTRLNTTAQNKWGYYPAAYKISVDTAGIAWVYDVGNLDWTADVYVSGPGGFNDWDFVWDDDGWQSIYMYTPTPGTYTVTATIDVDGYGWDYYGGGYWGDYFTKTMTVKETFVVPGAPTISGTAKVGNTVTAKPGTWKSGTTFSYQWYANGKAINGGRTNKLKLAPGHGGKKLTVKVTGRKAGSAAVSKTSAAKTVAKATLVAGSPKITGAAKVNDKLTANPGKWTGGTKITYQWYAGGKAISGAKSKTLKVTKAMKGKAIKVKVTGSKTGYTTVSKSSAATRPVK